MEKTQKNAANELLADILYSDNMNGVRWLANSRLEQCPVQPSPHPHFST